MPTIPPHITRITAGAHLNVEAFAVVAQDCAMLAMTLADSDRELARKVNAYAAAFRHAGEFGTAIYKGEPIDRDQLLQSPLACGTGKPAGNVSYPFEATAKELEAIAAGKFDDTAKQQAAKLLGDIRKNPALRNLCDSQADWLLYPVKKVEGKHSGMQQMSQNDAFLRALDDYSQLDLNPERSAGRG